MDNGDSGVMGWLSILLAVGLSIFWVTQVVSAARKRKWNDFYYSLSILLIMWSGLDLITAIVAVLGMIGVHRWIAQKEARDKDSGDI